MDTSNTPSGQGSRTGVSDETYDLMTTLSNKLGTVARREFAQDQKRGNRQLWESIPAARSGGSTAFSRN